MTEYTLAQIKSHPDFPFNDFMEKPLSFLMLELYWSQLFSELMGEYGKDWFSETEAQMDGNPIFSVVSLSHLREVRVIHKVNEKNLPSYPESIGKDTHYPLQAWLNKGCTLDGKIDLNELVIAADLSSEAEEVASNLLRLHCIDLANEATLEKAITDYETSVGMPE